MSDLGDLFGKKLNEQQFEVKPQYWSDMEKLLDKKKRRFFWLFNFNFLAGLAVVLIAGGTTVWFATKDHASTTSEIAQQSPDAGNKQLLNNNGEQQQTELNTTANNTIGNNSDGKTVASDISEQTANNNQIRNQNTIKQTPEKSTEKHKKNNTVAGISSIKKSSKDNKSAQINTNKTGNEAQLFSGTNSSDPAGITKTISGLPAALDLTLMNLIRLGNIDNSQKPAIHKLADLKTMDPAKAVQRKLHFYAGVYGGLMFSDKTLTTADHAYDEYVSRRKAEEKGAFTYSAGFDIGFSYGHWLFGTGINYHQQTDVSNYKNQFNHWTAQDSNYWNIIDNSHYEYNTVDYWLTTDNNYWATEDTTVVFWNSGTDALDTTMVTVPTYVVDGVDSTHVHYVDSVYVPQLDSNQVFNQDSTLELVSDVTYQQKRHVNKISYIEIPLLIGYEFPLGRFSLTAKTGVGIGILSTQDITYLRTNLTGIEKYSVATTNKLMWNYLFRFGANYYLSKHVALDVESFFRANLNNAFSKEMPVQQKYWNIGLNIGVSYKF